MPKLTDEQIVRNTERCLNGSDCNNCVYVDSSECQGEILEDALDLINRLKAENKDITEKFNCQQKVYSDLSEIIKKQAEELKTAKTEAYKEFAEKLKEKAFNVTTWNVLEPAVTTDVIDNLLKEMVGD